MSHSMTKPTKWHVRPAKTQISLGIHPVWSESLLCTHWKPTKWHVCPAKPQISLGIHPVWSVFTVRMKKAWVLSYPLSAQQRLWSDWADAQADLSLRWVHSHLVGFAMRRLKFDFLMFIRWWSQWAELKFHEARIYLHFIFRSFLCINCEESVLIVQNTWHRKFIKQRVRP